MANLSAATSEHSPLLRRSSSEAGPDAASQVVEDNEKKTTRSPFFIIALLFASMAMTQLSVSFVGPAFSQIEEGVICRRHHPDTANPAHDPRCKDNEVQADLSMLRGLEFSFSIAPAILLSLVYGIAADKYGRRPMLRLAGLGIMVIFPLDLLVFWFSDTLDIRLIWLVAVIATAIGGGISILEALILTIASDVSTPKQRTNIFFYFGASTVATPLLGNPLAYLAMEKGGPWLTSCIGCACNVAAFLLILAVPETINVKNVPDQDVTNSSASLPTNDASYLRLRWDEAILSAKNALKCLRAVVWDNKKLSLILISTLFTKIGAYVNLILLQYIAKRFSLSWAEANLAISIKYFTKLILTVLILPLVSEAVLRMTGSSLRRDLLLSRYCILITVVSTFGIGTTSSATVLYALLVPFSLIEGYSAAIKTLLTQLTNDGETAILFSTIAVLENIGLLLAGPGFAAAFRLGLQWGEGWSGLPLLLAALVFSVATIIVFSVKLDAEDVPTLD
ncbi:hypothetical protein QQS21_005012 [Conoideocrella luteorostrata]|uniref:Major facilitator superfamily (MFS) profile domain-containing protein n=1 Tax=Conoideocrella luteorostrata TaxID=1105319 RepID=A0AAJ0CSY4_9HYPO|nr:hypothetical protein QQS21_005012 [Conoideocrella luteorostrata]